MLRTESIEKIRDLGADIGVQELNDIILTNNSKDNTIIFIFEYDFNINVFHKAIRELDKEGLITEYVIEDGMDCVYLYSREDGTFQGAIQYGVEKDNHPAEWLELERSKLNKINEVVELNKRVQEIVNKGKLVSYPKRSLNPIRLNAQKGDIKEVYAMLFKILKISYEVMIKIPKQQKQYNI